MKYTIESTKNSTVVKLSDNILEATKIAKQMSAVFGIPFAVKEYKDVWSVNNSK